MADSKASSASKPSNSTPNAAHPIQDTRRPWQKKLHDIIFEAETPAGRWFDEFLLVAIVLSIVVVMLDSVPSINEKHHNKLLIAEYCFTALFTIEYILRLMAVRRKRAYALSFYGIIDLLAILPTYLIILFPQAHGAAIIRALRLMRIFRVLKLARFVAEASLLQDIIVRSREKMIIFLSGVFIIVVLAGTLIYELEHKIEEATISSIPEGVYWAIVTLTTVGYGDFVPHTVAGKILAAIMMLMGYALIVVPVGMFAAEYGRYRGPNLSTESCPSCGHEKHLENAKHCHRCGDQINDA